MGEANHSQPSPRETEAPAQQPQPQLQALPPAFEKSPTRFVQRPEPQVVQYAPSQPPPRLSQRFEPQGEQARPWSEGWYVAKLALGTGSLVTSVVLIAITIALIVKYGGYEAYKYYKVIIDVAIGLITGSLAMLWITTEFLVLFASKTKHGIHPGASVTLHFIICLVTAAGIGLVGASLSWYVGEGPSDVHGDDGGTGYYAGSAGSDIRNYNALVFMVQLVETIIAFMSLLEVIHSILLVRACVEMYQHNKWKVEHATRTVHVPAPMPHGYYTPVPGQEQMVFHPAPAPQPQQSWQTTRGGPAAPAQAHLYGYYAPVHDLTQRTTQTRSAGPPAVTANAVAGSSR